MEFSIHSQELVKGLYRAQGIVEKKAAMPILSNVLLSAHSDGTLSVSATDLEVGVQGNHPAEVLSEGRLTLSARHLYDIVRALPPEPVTIKKLENSWAEIRCGRIEYRLLGMAAEDFQELPDHHSALFFPVDPKVLAQMIEKTLFAVSTDETRFNLTGVFLERHDNQGIFRMVATDGYRLCLFDAKLSQKEDAQFGEGVIIPKKGLQEIRRLVESEVGDCLLGLSGNNLVFRVNKVTVVMRLLDGQFPEYSHVIPENQNIHLKLSKKPLAESLRRISILSNDRTLGLKLKLSEQTLQISTSNPDLGEAKEEMAIDYAGKEFAAVFNARFLLDAMASIDKEFVELSLDVDDDRSPCVIRPEGESHHICIVMPMRT